MVNELKVLAWYNNKHQIIECTQGDFLEKAAKEFDIINVHNIELYSINNDRKRRIVPSEITDLMKIRMEDKRMSNGQQRTMDSYTRPRGYENIISKLKNNSILTGQERKEMVLMLESYSTNLSNKRKIDDVTPEPKMCHKKVQVDIHHINSKESTTQTDEITLSTSLQDGGIIDDQIAEKMKKLSSNSNVNMQEVSKLMTDSYDDRRVFIMLKSPPIPVLKEKYPFLFELQEVKNEVRRIFYSEKPAEFIKNMYKYAPLIVQKCKSDDLLKRTKKTIERCHTTKQKKYAEVVGSVFILTDLMKEQWRFIHLLDYPSGSDDMYPHIDASSQNFKDLFTDGSLYDIKVERELLCTAHNFMEAIMCLVAAFFIFNIDYPPSCRNTMIMFEKLYLKANDTLNLDDQTMQMVKLLELEAKSLSGKH